jgi:hypothetical protein
VDGFLDRLADLLRTLLGERGGSSRSRSTNGSNSASAPGGAPYRDPDLREAWEELDDYMRGGTGERTSRTREQRSRRPQPPADESLRQDYANLEVPFGADIETVRNSYRSLMLRYHPDKHADDPEKHRIALEITKKINESFERIRARHGAQ